MMRWCTLPVNKDYQDLNGVSMYVYIYIYLCVYNVYLGTSIFEGQRPQNKAFSIQDNGHLGF